MAAQARELIEDEGELQGRLGLKNQCDVNACTGGVDERGPVSMRDGTYYKMCTDHWEGIFSVLGAQATAEQTDRGEEGSDWLLDEAGSFDVNLLRGYATGDDEDSDFYDSPMPEDDPNPIDREAELYERGHRLLAELAGD